MIKRLAQENIHGYLQRRKLNARVTIFQHQIHSISVPAMLERTLNVDVVVDKVDNTIKDQEEDIAAVITVDIEEDRAIHVEDAAATTIMAVMNNNSTTHVMTRRTMSNMAKDIMAITRIDIISSIRDQHQVLLHIRNLHMLRQQGEPHNHDRFLNHHNRLVDHRNVQEDHYLPTLLLLMQIGR
jgi:hypothetical protein